MKKVALIAVLALTSAALVVAQQNALNRVDSPHYRVYSAVSASDAQSISNEMEALFTLFNSYLHFDPSTLSTRLNVRIYADKSQFNDYLSQIVPGQRGSFVYLQYSDPRRSVLVGYHEQNEKSFQRELIHHGFVQFLRSFISEPPLWLQEGFAVYFENSQYNPATGVAEYQPNLAWLPTLKQRLQLYLAGNTDQIIQPADLLSIDTAGANAKIDAFYAESWGLVSYLIGSENKDYNRLLWDTVNALSPKATAAQNETAIEARAFKWVSVDNLELGFKNYVGKLKTFPELVQDGMKAYSSGKLKAAEADFKSAVSLDRKNYVPYYYLGLINYDGKDYFLAEQYFQTSLQMGGSPGLVNYALGINAFAENRIADAKKYLSLAVSTQSAYKDKAASLLERISQKPAQ